MTRLVTFMKRVVTKIGHIFCIEIDGEYKLFFQYVANDYSYLNSSVIRVFKNKYPMDYKPNMDEIVKDEVWFSVHVMLNNGVREGIWYRVGKHADLGDVENIMFYGLSEYRVYTNEKGYPSLEHDHTWYIWKINQEFKYLGPTLPDEYKHLTEGSVFPAQWVIGKIKTGKFAPLLEE